MTAAPAGLAGEPPASRTLADILLERSADADVVAAMTTVASIQRVAMRLRRHLEQGVLKDSDLTWSGFMVLCVLWLYGELQTRYIAAEVGVNRSTLSGVLTTLERRGLLSRCGHDVDGRLVLVALTGAGRSLVEKVAPAIGAAQLSVVSPLQPDSMRRLDDALRSIEQRLAPAEENPS
jgi:DNA-binding MarR family transcriptional regulator